TSCSFSCVDDWLFRALASHACHGIYPWRSASLPQPPRRSALQPTNRACSRASQCSSTFGKPERDDAVCCLVRLRLGGWIVCGPCPRTSCRWVHCISLGPRRQAWLVVSIVGRLRGSVDCYKLPCLSGSFTESTHPGNISEDQVLVACSSSSRSSG